MKTRMLLSLIPMAVACLLASGCDDSKNPLSDPQNSQSDSRLAGVWRIQDKDGDVTYYHVGAVGEKLPASVMRLIGVTHPKNGSLSPPAELLVFPTTLGGNTYLNLTDGGEKQIKLIEEKGWKSVDTYFLLKYKIEDDVLMVWSMDPDAKERAIKAGKVKGIVEPVKNGPSRIRFTDTTENVARFVADAGDSLFSTEVLRMKRVK